MTGSQLFQAANWYIRAVPFLILILVFFILLVVRHLVKSYKKFKEEHQVALINMGAKEYLKTVKVYLVPLIVSVLLIILVLTYYLWIPEWTERVWM